jgi:hypothetical protein
MPEICHAFLCEDIRQELSNQITAVGIWSGRIVVPTFPAVLRSFALHVNFKNSERLPYPFRTRIEGPYDRSTIGELAFDGVCSTDPGFTGQHFNIIIGALRILEAGVIRASFEILAQPPVVKVVELDVTDVPPASSVSTKASIPVPA